MNNNNEPFSFELSLSILNQLGRGLYRNFITIIGEAISNSWDADATNVQIYILDMDDGTKDLVIKDDGIGMNAVDFQGKFLTIGYSKRKKGVFASKKKRPFIGRKGIGKLALLSCADEISVWTKTKNDDYVGGVINNKGLDDAIKDDIKPDQYPLKSVDESVFSEYKEGHKHGTIIYFKTLNEKVKNTESFLMKSIALHFRFSLLDKNFNIYLNDKKITINELNELIDNTQFVWKINNHEGDELYNKIHAKALEKEILNLPNHSVTGFIASVDLPKNLNIHGIGEKTGVDFFVNGRLRETNMLLRGTEAFPTQHVASYLYGQIHYNEMDSKDEDPFTTSREGVTSKNSDYTDLINSFIPVLKVLSKKWDEWRRKHKKDGASDDTSIPKYQRKIEESKNARAKDFKDKIDSLRVDEGTKNRLKETLKKQSYSNTQIYQDLFILENLFREYIKAKGVSSFSDILEKSSENKITECVSIAKKYKKSKKESEEAHALGGAIRRNENDLNYFDLVCLGVILDLLAGKNWRKQNMEAHAKEINPIRNAVMHTSEITTEVMNWKKIEKIIDILDKMFEKDN